MARSSDSDNGDKEIVTFLALNTLSDNPGAIKKKRRVGRGIGSSKGKTCGRGHKGQKARAGGGVKPGFEGGQTKFYKRIPKRGFKNAVHAQPMVPVNVGTLQDFVDMGRLPVQAPDDPPYTIADLVRAGITTRSTVKHGVKLLANGRERLRPPGIRIDVSRASKGAVQAMEAVGGEVTTVHYNRLALKVLLKPQRFEILPKRALPPPRLMTYYNNYENRGYLSPEIQRNTILRRLKREQEADGDGDAPDSKE